MKAAAYRKYMVTVLAVILAFNYVDRTILGLTLQSIKRDLALSDTQLGLLTGLAFALFYAVMGIPIARWADRGNRVTIISLTATLWSVAVALCGLAATFTQLLLIRVAVAVGEAGCLPPAHSLIADYFYRAERPRAVARYMLGGSLANVIGFLFAGWLNQLYGWRVTFMALGLPGLGLAILSRLSLKEPRRGTPPAEVAGVVRTRAAAASGAASPDAPSLAEVFAHLWGSRTFRNILLSFAICAFFNYGIVQWQPVFFVRSFGVKTGELGTWFAVLFGVGGLLGTFFGGELAARYAARNERLQLKVIAIVYGGVGVLTAFVYLSPNQYLAFAWTGLAGVAGAAANGPLFATIQTLVPDRMRAMSIAIIYLSANLIGMGLGPLAAGAMSDAFQPWAGDESLRYALLALSPGYVWGAWHLLRASDTVTGDLEALDAERAKAGPSRSPVPGAADTASLAQ
jgi:MFS family permease